MPPAVDQFGNAGMLAEAGVGLTIDRGDVTPGALRAAAAALDTDATRARADELAAELRAAGGAARAADLVEAEARS